MTTIATDGKAMAADGLVTGNGLRHMDDCRKIFTLEDGRIVGMAGSCFLHQDAIDFLNGKRDEIDLGDDFEAIILHPNGKCECMDGEGRCYKQSVPAVTGSGGAVALGAMAHGASPKQAVKIAAQFDTATGGVVTSKRPRS